MPDNFILYKCLKYRDCLRMPPEWARTAYFGYRKTRIKAEKEKPPGRNVLLVGIFQALVSKDTSFIDRAVKLVGGNMPEHCVLLLTGGALCDLGHREEGLRRLRRALTLNPSAGNMVALAGYLDNRADYYEKLKLSHRVLQQNPNDVDALRHAAFVLVNYGRLEEAENYIQRAIDISPHNGFVREALAEVFYRRGQYESALKQYKRARESYLVTPTRLCQQIASTYYFLGKFGRAKNAALKMKKAEVREFQLKPDTTFADCLLDEIEGRRQLGLEYCSKDFKPCAYPYLRIESARERVAGEPTLYFAAMETIRTKDTAHIDNAVTKIGDNVAKDVLLSLSGRAKYEAGYAEEGLVQMRTAVTLNPSPQNTYNLAVCLSCRPESKAEAKGLFERICSEVPDDVEALSYLASLSDDPQKALEFYRRASEIEHDNWQIYCGMGKALYSLGRFEEAVDKYEQARSLIDGNPAGISTSIGRCYFAMRKYKEALESAERAVVEDPRSEAARELVAQTRKAMARGI